MSLKYYIIVIFIFIILLVFNLKNKLKEGFSSSRVVLNDPFGYQQSNWIMKNREDPLKYNKDLDNLGGLITYRKEMNHTPTKYIVDYTISKDYIDKCKGGKTFWKYAGANVETKQVPNGRGGSNCKDTCTNSNWCQAYLTNPSNGLCYHSRFKDNHSLGYRCSKPFYQGEWYGDVKVSANRIVNKVELDDLVPGSMVALWNPFNQRFMRVNPNGNVDSCCPMKMKVPNGWMWERFLVVKGGNGTVALWNPSNQRFIRMNPNGNVDSCCPVKNGKLPNGWTWEKWKVTHNLDGTISLWNPNQKRFARMNSNGNVDSCCPVNNGVLPNNWPSEKWKVVKLDVGKLSKRWKLVAKCCVKYIEIYNGSVYGLGTDHAIYKSELNSKMQWTKISTPWVSMFTIYNGDIIGVGGGSGLWYRANVNNWYPFPNSCCITYIDFYKRIYGVGPGTDLWIYSPPEKPNRWKRITNNAKIKQFKIYPQNQKIYGVSLDGNIYEVGLYGGIWKQITYKNDSYYIDVYKNTIFSVSKTSFNVWCYDLTLKQWNKMTPSYFKTTQIKIYQDYIYGIGGDLQVWKYPIHPIKINYNSLGCWRDSGNRAIKPTLPGYNPSQKIRINECAERAAKAGYSVFGVQYGGECYSNKDAEKTYRKYGRANNCSKDGKGGTWANSVYQLKK